MSGARAGWLHLLGESPISRSCSPARAPRCRAWRWTLRSSSGTPGLSSSTQIAATVTPVQADNGDNTDPLNGQYTASYTLTKAGSYTLATGAFSADGTLNTRDLATGIVTGNGRMPVAIRLGHDCSGIPTSKGLVHCAHGAHRPEGRRPAAAGQGIIALGFLSRKV